ncbi:MAG: hypothetical protein K0R54_5644 [Clostridiaceae bacterium]|jgi:hypothetical protein|nr:hypothetical protein [Clostridiaceae bacterium]
MSNVINFSTSATQTSIANQEIIQPNKPEGYNGTFIANYFDFYNDEDCHVLVNDNTTPMFIKSGGFTFGSIYQLRILKIVEENIHYNFSGVAPESPALIQTIGKGLHMLGIMAIPPVIILNEGETKQINVVAVRPVLYNNSIMPVGTIYESSNELVATVNNSGLVSFVGNGYCQITITNNGYIDIIQITCI